MKKNFKRTNENSNSDNNNNNNSNNVKRFKDNRKKTEKLKRDSGIESMLSKQLFSDLNEMNDILISKEKSKLVKEKLVNEKSKSKEKEKKKEKKNNNLLKKTPKKSPKAVWVDDDDAKVSQEGKIIRINNLEKKLRKEFTATSNVDWANQTSNVTIPNIFATTASRTTRNAFLPTKDISLTKLKNVNINSKQSEISSINFHPNNKLFCAASSNGVLSLYKLNNRSNNLISTSLLSNFEIKQAKFTFNGENVICTANKHYYYYFDILSESHHRVSNIGASLGNSFRKFIISPDNQYIVFLSDSGSMIITSSKSKKLIAELKMNGNVHSACFSADGRYLYSTGSDCEIYKWDFGSRVCMHKFIDYGSISTKAISFSSDNNWLVTGSSSGVVNIYDPNKIYSEQLVNPKPEKMLMNLTTKISSKLLQFNSDNQLLAMGSTKLKNSMRLVHFPSLSVYSNWPINMAEPKSFDFSIDSRFFALSTKFDKIELYKLNHYSSVIQ
eukprot:TRINITY_DN291_c0_g4_i1.p1 TRINITY_DN291_c0_g4~~TRINITY_DN291_c0_g4_i1.p1  ORF type:complete len:498 (+),score=174.85 TRINITY_DN291_c0_g4_i1:121-1614(+)